MIKKNLVQKTFVLLVIALFLGVMFAPGITATEQKVGFDKEYYDVNIELCGLGKENTVQLTEQQLTEIDVVFGSIKDDLDNAKTQEETIRIYNDAIVELDRYGLFGDRNVKQVQNLIIGKYLISSNNHVLHTLSENKQSSDENFFCLMCGHTDNTFFLPGISMWLFSLVNSLVKIVESEELLVAAFMGAFFRIYLAELLLGRFHLNNPIALGSGIMLSFSRGWVHTLGLFGVKSWAGVLYGQIFVFETAGRNYCGVTGFTGIKIMKRPINPSGYPEYYYLGFANHVHLGTEQP